MDITKLALHNFRNFADIEEITLPTRSLLVAAAPNATGKTNFLESIVMLLRGKSFRSSHAECVRWGEESFSLEGHIHTQRGEHDLAVRYHQPTRRLALTEDGVPVSPVTFYSHYPVVLFLPEDTFLFMRGPAGRRNFLNRVLVSNSAYVSALVQYQRALKQRNSALKTADSFAAVAGWTEILVEHGATLWRYREQLISFISSHLPQWYQRISGEEAEFAVRLSGEKRDTASFQATLEELFPHERRYGYTLHGPHRDDVEVMVGGRPVAVTLSQGQMRGVVLALKLATYQFIKQTTGEQPLLLLDEALSELDSTRQETLLNNLPATQTLLTCTAVPDVLRRRGNVHILDLRSIMAEQAPIGTPRQANVPVPG